jgi:hypothetical protein
MTTSKSVTSLFVLAMMLFAPSAAHALGPFCGKGSKAFVGKYELRGVPEVGSQLVIRKDGSFEFALAYGANDQYGKGCWTQTDRVIALFADDGRKISGDHTPDTRGFKGLVLEKSGKDLLWRIAGSGYTGRFKRY